MIDLAFGLVMVLLVTRYIVRWFETHKPPSKRVHFRDLPPAAQRAYMRKRRRRAVRKWKRMLKGKP